MKGGIIHAADDRYRRQRFDFQALLHPGTVFEHPKVPAPADDAGLSRYLG